MHSRLHQQELQDGLGDLVALSALPRLLAEDEPGALAEHLAAILLKTLRLDLAYACVRDHSGGVHEATVTDSLIEDVLSEDQGPGSLHTLNRWEHWRNSTDGVVQLNGTTLHVSMRSIGLHAEWGLLGVASQRPEFPTQLEATKFQVIANYTWALIRGQHRWRSHPIGEPNGIPGERPSAPLSRRHPNGPDAVSDARHGGVRPSMTSEELKAGLKQLGLSQQKLARSIAVSVGTVKKWSQGKARIPGPAVLLIRLMIEKHQDLPTSFNSRPIDSSNRQREK